MFQNYWILIMGRVGIEPTKTNQQIYNLRPLAAWIPTLNIPNAYFNICKSKNP